MRVSSHVVRIIKNEKKDGGEKSVVDHTERYWGKSDTDVIQCTAGERKSLRR